MVKPSTPQKLAYLFAAVALAATASACRAPGVVDPEVTPYSAYRPAFRPTEPKRTLFLGGYAGYNYGPISNQTELATRSGGEVWGYPVARPPFSGWFGRR